MPIANYLKIFRIFKDKIMTMLIPLCDTVENPPVWAPQMGEFYPMPSDGTTSHREWTKVTAQLIPIDKYKQRMVEAVQRSLDKKLFYTTDILADVIHDMRDLIAPGVLEAKNGVEGGPFGMEVYYAHDYLRRIIEIKNKNAAVERLNLRTGTPLGSLIFNDYKLNTNCSVLSTDEGGYRITGKRGKFTISFTTDASSIECAMDRAFEKGKRKFKGLETPSVTTLAKPQIPADPLQPDMFSAPVDEPERNQSIRPKM